MNWLICEPGPLACIKEQQLCRDHDYKPLGSIMILFFHLLFSDTHIITQKRSLLGMLVLPNQQSYELHMGAGLPLFLPVQSGPLISVPSQEFLTDVSWVTANWSCC